MKKRIVSLVVTALCVMMMGATVGASSPNTNTTPEPEVEYATAYIQDMSVVVQENGTDAKVDGVADYVGVVMQPVLVAKLDEANNVAREMVAPTANILHMAEVTLTEDVAYENIQIRFAVNGVTAGQGILCLHQKADGSWEKITPDSVEDGYVTVTFTSLSPVAFVSYGSSPKTGEELPVVLGIATLALLGCAIAMKKSQK